MSTKWKLVLAPNILHNYIIQLSLLSVKRKAERFLWTDNPLRHCTEFIRRRLVVYHVFQNRKWDRKEIKHRQVILTLTHLTAFFSTLYLVQSCVLMNLLVLTVDFLCVDAFLCINNQWFLSTSIHNYITGLNVPGEWTVWLFRITALLRKGILTKQPLSAWQKFVLVLAAVVSLPEFHYSPCQCFTKSVALFSCPHPLRQFKLNGINGARTTGAKSLCYVPTTIIASIIRARIGWRRHTNITLLLFFNVFTQTSIPCNQSLRRHIDQLTGQIANWGIWCRKDTWVKGSFWKCVT